MYPTILRIAAGAAAAILLAAGLSLVQNESAVPAPTDPPAAKPATTAGANPAEPAAKPRFRAGREAIEAALDGTVADGFAFVETPLDDVAAYVQDHYKIPVVLDRRVLADAGLIPEDTPVTFRVSDISLRNALRAMLREYDLTFTIHHDALLITSTDHAEWGLLRTRVYEVADLVACRDDQGRLWDDYDSLIDVVVDAVRPDSWQEVGGPGTIEGLSIPGAKTLIIRQSDDIHRKVARLLDDLRKLRAERPGGNLPPLRKYQPEVRPIVSGPIPVVGEQVRAQDAREAESVEPPGAATMPPPSARPRTE